MGNDRFFEGLNEFSYKLRYIPQSQPVPEWTARATRFKPVQAALSGLLLASPIDPLPEAALGPIGLIDDVLYLYLLIDSLPKD